MASGAGEKTTATVTFQAPQFKDAGLAQAHLQLDESTHAALFAYVK